MEQPIQTANYLREVQGLNIKIYNLDTKDQLLWYEVEELLKDNGLWDSYNYDDEDRYFRHAKRIYAVTTKMFNFNRTRLMTDKYLWTPEIKSVIYSPEESLYRYMYEPEYCDNYYGNKRYCIQLPILNDDCVYNYIIILLENDNVILGRYGVTEFGYELSKCYYDDDIKQVPFDKLDEPYKSLIIEKLLEEEEQGYNMENLIHLMPKKFDIKDYIAPGNYIKEEYILDDYLVPTKYCNNAKEEKEIMKTKIPSINWGSETWKILEKIIKEQNEEKSKNLLQENISQEEKKGNIVMNDPLGRGHFPVSITSSPIRQFSGTIGLLYNNEGYYDYGGKKKLSWSLDDVKELIRKYMRQRSIDKKFDLCIGLSNIETLCYTWENNFIEEPIVRVYGEMVSRHDGISDEEILNALFELFTYLKVDLKQHSVRFNYQGFTEHKSYRIGDGK